MMAFLFIIAILGFLIASSVGIYNSVVILRNTSEQSWSDIDVQLKRRHDLVPNLVETVKGYAAHERDTFEKVVQARNIAMRASSPVDKAEAGNTLQATLRSLLRLPRTIPN